MFGFAQREDFRASYPAAGFLAFSSSFLFDHHTAAESPASKTAAINKRAELHAFLSTCVTTAPLPPYADSSQNDEQRNHDHAGIEHHPHLARIHVQAAVRRVPWAGSKSDLRPNDSQLYMFRNRSRLPLKRRNEFEHQLDEPTTTNRPLPSPLPL